MRLVSMVELMAIRERVHNGLAPLFEKPVDDSTLNILRDADLEFRHWYQTWDQAFSQKYEDAGLSLHPSQRLYSHAHLSLQPSIDKVSSTNILRRNYSIMRLLSRVSRYLKMFRRCHLGRRSLARRLVRHTRSSVLEWVNDTSPTAQSCHRSANSANRAVMKNIRSQFISQAR